MKTFNILLFSCFTMVSMAQQQKRFPKLSEAENQTIISLFSTTEQAQSFANGMEATNGVAKIENVAIENGNLELEKVANALAFEKVTVSKATTIDFVATNTIDLSETSMIPDNTGDVSLQIKGFEDNTLIEKLPENESSATKVYPNPSADVYTIFGSAVKVDNEINVIDLNGRIVYKEKCNDNQKTQLDLAGLQSGVYLLYIYEFNGTSSFVCKLFKK